MPIYEYRCTTCSKSFEVFAKMSDPPPTECEHCGAATVEKVLHPASVHYKGSGFYATDYAGKGKKPKPKESTGGSSEGGSSSSESSGSSSSDASSGGSSDSSGSSSSSSSTD